ncbi:MAG: radical SAM protein [Patescibacteria group bacterium]|jgi:radical SAM protein with 4Fe4S-binding SPASM domain
MDTKPKLRKLEIQLTPRCNINCIYCGNPPERKKLNENLDISAVERCLEELQPRQVSFTGGEVCLAWDTLLEGMDIARGLGIEIHLSTNLTLLNKEKIDILCDKGLTSLHTSFNDLTADMSFKVRGASEKQRENLIKNIEYLSNQKSIYTIAETVLIPETYKQIGEIHKFLATLGIDEHQVQTLIPSGTADWGIMLSPDELCEAVESACSSKQPGVIMNFLCLYLTRCSPYADRIYKSAKTDSEIQFGKCREGLDLAYIRSNGDMYPCFILSLKDAPNIFKKSPKEIWEKDHLFTLVRDLEERPSKCKSCVHWKKNYPTDKIICRNECWALSLMETGSLRNLAYEVYLSKFKK